MTSTSIFAAWTVIGLAPVDLAFQKNVQNQNWFAQASIALVVTLALLVLIVWTYAKTSWNSWQSRLSLRTASGNPTPIASSDLSVRWIWRAVCPQRFR